MTGLLNLTTNVYKNCGQKSERHRSKIPIQLENGSNSWYCTRVHLCFVKKLTAHV